MIDLDNEELSKNFISKLEELREVMYSNMEAQKEGFKKLSKAISTRIDMLSTTDKESK